MTFSGQVSALDDEELTLAVVGRNAHGAHVSAQVCLVANQPNQPNRGNDR